MKWLVHPEVSIKYKTLDLGVEKIRGIEITSMGSVLPSLIQNELLTSGYFSRIGATFFQSKELNKGEMLTFLHKKLEGSEAIEVDVDSVLSSENKQLFPTTISFAGAKAEIKGVLNNDKLKFYSINLNSDTSKVISDELLSLDSDLMGVMTENEFIIPANQKTIKALVEAFGTNGINFESHDITTLPKVSNESYPISSVRFDKESSKILLSSNSKIDADTIADIAERLGWKRTTIIDDHTIAINPIGTSKGILFLTGENQAKEVASILSGITSAPPLAILIDKNTKQNDVLYVVGMPQFLNRVTSISPNFAKPTERKFQGTLTSYSVPFSITSTSVVASALSDLIVGPVDLSNPKHFQSPNIMLPSGGLTEVAQKHFLSSSNLEGFELAMAGNGSDPYAEAIYSAIDNACKQAGIDWEKTRTNPKAFSAKNGIGFRSAYGNEIIRNDGKKNSNLEIRIDSYSPVPNFTIVDYGSEGNNIPAKTMVAVRETFLDIQRDLAIRTTGRELLSKTQKPQAKIEFDQEKIDLIRAKEVLEAQKTFDRKLTKISQRYIDSKIKNSDSRALTKKQLHLANNSNWSLKVVSENTSETLYIPATGEDGKIKTFQRHTKFGDKLFLKGGAFSIDETLINSYPQISPENPLNKNVSISLWEAPLDCYSYVSIGGLKESEIAVSCFTLGRVVPTIDNLAPLVNKIINHADFDGFKPETGNGGMLKAIEASARHDNVSFTYIDGNHFSDNGIHKIKDISDLTSIRDSATQLKILNTFFKVDQLSIYSDSKGPAPIRDFGQAIPQDTLDPIVIFQHMANSGAKQISSSQAVVAINETVKEEHEKNITDIPTNNAIAKNLAKAPYLPNGTDINDRLISSAGEPYGQSDYKVRNDFQIMYHKGDRAGTPLLLNGREVFVKGNKLFDSLDRNAHEHLDEYGKPYNIIMNDNAFAKASLSEHIGNAITEVSNELKGNPNAENIFKNFIGRYYSEVTDSFSERDLKVASGKLSTGNRSVPVSVYVQNIDNEDRFIQDAIEVFRNNIKEVFNDFTAIENSISKKNIDVDKPQLSIAKTKNAQISEILESLKHDNKFIFPFKKHMLLEVKPSSEKQHSWDVKLYSTSTNATKVHKSVSLENIHRHFSKHIDYVPNSFNEAESKQIERAVYKSIISGDQDKILAAEKIMKQRFMLPNAFGEKTDISNRFVESKNSSYPAPTCTLVEYASLRGGPRTYDSAYNAQLANAKNTIAILKQATSDENIIKKVESELNKSISKISHWKGDMNSAGRYGASLAVVPKNGLNYGYRADSGQIIPHHEIMLKDMQQKIYDVLEAYKVSGVVEGIDANLFALTEKIRPDFAPTIHLATPSYLTKNEVDSLAERKIKPIFRLQTIAESHKEIFEIANHSRLSGSPVMAYKNFDVFNEKAIAGEHVLTWKTAKQFGDLNNQIKKLLQDNNIELKEFYAVHKSRNFRNKLPTSDDLSPIGYIVKTKELAPIIKQLAKNEQFNEAEFAWRENKKEPTPYLTAKDKGETSEGAIQKTAAFAKEAPPTISNQSQKISQNHQTKSKQQPSL